MWPFDIANRRRQRKDAHALATFKQERWVAFVTAWPYPPGKIVEVCNFQLNNTIFIYPCDLPVDLNIDNLFWRCPKGACEPPIEILYNQKKEYHV